MDAASDKHHSCSLFHFRVQWAVTNCSGSPEKLPVQLGSTYTFVAAAICLSWPDLNTWSACNLLMEIDRWQRQKEGRRETQDEERKGGWKHTRRNPDSGNERLCAANFLIRGRGDHRHCGSGGATRPRLSGRMHDRRTSQERRGEKNRTCASV